MVLHWPQGGRLCWLCVLFMLDRLLRPTEDPSSLRVADERDEGANLVPRL